MTVYLINTRTIHDRAAYETYVAGFMPVFRKFGGSLLAIQDAPKALEGAWPYDRSVLISFPTGEEAKRWLESAEYQEIAKHRHAGTVSNAVMLDGLPERL